VKLYKRALLEAGMQRTTVARRLSVLRGTYKQLAAKGLVSWETAQDIAAIQAPTGVEKNTTPALTQKQAIARRSDTPVIRSLLTPGLDFSDLTTSGQPGGSAFLPLLRPPHGRRRRGRPKRVIPVAGGFVARR